MIKAFKTVLFVSSPALAIAAVNMRADAQPFGPGPGGMMGDGWGWGMGWGMGGLGGGGLLLIALLVAGFTFLVLRRRNS
jgi:hypothetical protein